jgi:GDP-L-fucose synthase
MFIDNMHMNMNIVDVCDKLQVKRFICILSTCIFPDKQILTEDDIHQGPPHSSNEGYAMAKRMMEVDCRLRTMNTICLVPTNLFGFHDNYSIEDGHVIPALIHKCYIAKNTNTPFVILGSGKAKRQFLFSGDFAEIIEWSIDKPMSSNHEVYICSSNDEEVTISHVAETIAKIFNYDNIIYDSAFPDGQHQKRSLNSKLMKEFNGEFSNFKDKLSETIDFFIKHSVF